LRDTALGAESKDLGGAYLTHAVQAFSITKAVPTLKRVHRKIVLSGFGVKKLQAASVR
jgi:hypothetical protein